MLKKTDLGKYSLYLRRNFHIKAQKSEEYNQSNTLITLFSDIFNQIIACCHTHDNNEIKALEKSIKTFMQFSATCKAMHKFLTHEVIGNFCKDYTPETKLKMFRTLMEPTYKPGDEIKHLPAVILLCAGTENTHIKNELSCLLIEAIRSNNIQRAATLFKHNADPNTQDNTVPVFFHAETVEMAQVFIHNKVDIDMNSLWPDTNVLWEVVRTKYPSELMGLYLTHRVNAETLRPSDESCLLHALGWSNLNIDNHFLKKAQLLVEAIPHMINTINQRGETPLDLAHSALETYYKKNINPGTLNAVITLFRRCGGKTAQELKIEKANNPSVP